MQVKTILYSSHFERALKSLGPEWKEVVDERAALFQENCFHARLKTHKLKGNLKEYWSFSLTQKHRVLFQFLKKGTVVFIDVEDHSVYR